MATIIIIIVTVQQIHCSTTSSNYLNVKAIILVNSEILIISYVLPGWNKGSIIIILYPRLMHYFITLHTLQNARQCDGKFDRL